jgi:hypothetical protein
LIGQNYYIYEVIFKDLNPPCQLPAHAKNDFVFATNNVITVDVIIYQFGRSLEKEEYVLCMKRIQVWMLIFMIIPTLKGST